MYSKDDIFIFGIDVIHRVIYDYTMGIMEQKSNNLIKLMNGFALLDNQEQERIINMVDTLNTADENIKKDVFSYFSPLKEETTSAYADDDL